jgi:hypothetical protein
MAEQTQLVIPEPQQTLTPMDLMRIALTNQSGIEVIERLAALQEKTMARKAEIAFNEALNRVQSEIRRIAPDLDNKQTSSRYASYAALDKILRPIYSKEGFSLSFNTADCDKPLTVRVTCRVSLGAHSEHYQIDMPADGKGAKGGDVMTLTHATGSAVTYGMRYLLKAIFNVAIGEDDDDGNSNGELIEQLDWIASAKDMTELKRLYRDAYAKFETNAPAIRTIVDARKKRQKELE